MEQYYHLLEDLSFINGMNSNVGSEGNQILIRFIQNAIEESKDEYRGILNVGCKAQKDRICHGYWDCPTLMQLVSMNTNENQKTCKNENNVGTNINSLSSLPQILSDRPRRSCSKKDSDNTPKASTGRGGVTKKKKVVKRDLRIIPTPCLCDSNPLCLATVGGAITNVLYENSKAILDDENSFLQKEKPNIASVPHQTEKNLNLLEKPSEEKKSDDLVEHCQQKHLSKEDEMISKEITSEKTVREIVDMTQSSTIEDEPVAMDLEKKKKKFSGEMEAITFHGINHENNGQDKLSQTNGIPLHSQDKQICNKISNQHTKQIQLSQISRNEAISEPLPISEERDNYAMTNLNKVVSTSDLSDDDCVLIVEQQSNKHTPSLSLTNVEELLPINIPDQSLELIKPLRKSIEVPKKKILTYLKTVIQIEEPIRNIYLAVIINFHSKLLYETNELKEENDNIILSIPPGIHNLGATCYLNSFLQCLAHNPKFLEKFSSWKEQGSYSSLGGQQMSYILSSLQSLLLYLRYGHENSVSAKEFATSLKLDEGEMQDPIEFARLLFDRIQELFNDTDLKFLLPELFQGTIENKTRCHYCKTCVGRNESFMDWMIPLSHGNTLQELIDNYFSLEQMTGENQYFCSSCNQKRDAERSCSISKFPLVINIQVARYTYNMQTWCKQKSLKEIFLNDEIILNKGWSYRLVGVLYHLGNSAHGGHYVSHVMDWITGLWFEFNDENVTWLKNGPPALCKEREVSKKMKNGSTDAYHLVYVESRCLNETVKLEIKNEMNMELWRKNGCLTMKEIMETKTSYFLQVDKMKAQYRGMKEYFRRQRDQIFKIMIPRLTNDVSVILPNQEEAVWVPTTMLKNFFNCKGENTDSPIYSNDIFCKHGSLHPRMARKGKLISKKMYKQLCDFLPQNEQGPHGYYITAQENVKCIECGAEYKQHIHEKLCRFVLLLHIYNETSTSKMNESDEIYSKFQGSKNVYLVSRRFISDLRRYIEKKMKEVVSSFEIQGEGIDALDLSLIFPMKKQNENNDAGKNVTSDSNANGSTKDLTTFDFKVNSNIICPHNSCHMGKKASKKVRFVSPSLWNEIVALFPDAIAVNNVNCSKCEEELNNDEQFSSQMHTWFASQNNSVINYIEKKQEYPLKDEEEVRIVSKFLVDDWKFCLQACKKKKQNDNYISPLLAELFTGSQVSEKFEYARLTCIPHEKSCPIHEYIDWYVRSQALDHNVQDSLNIQGIENHSFCSQEIMPCSLYEMFFFSLQNLGEIFVNYKQNGDSGTDLHDRISPFVIKLKLNFQSSTYEIFPEVCRDNNCKLHFQYLLEENYQQKLGNLKTLKKKEYECIDVDAVKLIDIDKQIDKDIKSINVFVIDDNMDLEYLAEIEHNSCDNLDPTRRRSSRKRKTSNPSINRQHEIQCKTKTDSLAKLRLLLMEENEISPLLHELILSFRITHSIGEPMPQLSLVSLADYRNDMTLDEIVTQYLENQGLSQVVKVLGTMYIYAIKLNEERILNLLGSGLESCNSLDSNGKSKKKKKISKYEIETLESQLVDELMRSIGSESPYNGRRPKSIDVNGIEGNIESGFQGTLLQSSLAK